MVDVAQLVSASDCGSEGRGFESPHPPHFLMYRSSKEERVHYLARGLLIMGCRQAVRHQTLTLAFAGSNPASPAKYDSLAQLVEQRPFKAKVRGSSPRRVTKIRTQHPLCPYFYTSGTRTPQGVRCAPQRHFGAQPSKARLLARRCPRRVTKKQHRLCRCCFFMPWDESPMQLLFIPVEIFVIMIIS